MASIELRQIEYFLAVAEHGNFSRAAENLHLSQPALSVQIKQLENSLNCRLLDRTGKRVVATEAGEELIKHCRRILSDVDEACAAVEQMQGLNKGNLSVGVLQTINACLMPQTISRFIANYPDIRLNIAELSATEIETGVAEGTLALGISFTPCQFEGITWQTLFSEELVIISRGRIGVRTGNVVNVHSLKDRSMVMFPSGFHTRRIVDEVFRRGQSVPRIVLETSTIQSILLAVRNVGLITIFPRLTLKLAEAKGLYAYDMAPSSSARRSVGLLWQRGTTHKKSAAAFADEFQQTIAASNARIKLEKDR